MMFSDQRRWGCSALLAMSCVIPVAALAQYDDVLGFRILSESQDKLVVEISTYYYGSHGQTAYVSVLPSVGGRVTPNVGYSSGRCPNSNDLKVGRNATCMTLSMVQDDLRFRTDGLKVCLFGGSSRESFHCESFGHVKHWGSPSQVSPRSTIPQSPYGNVAPAPDFGIVKVRAVGSSSQPGSRQLYVDVNNRGGEARFGPEGSCTIKHTSGALRIPLLSQGKIPPGKSGTLWSVPFGVDHLLEVRCKINHREDSNQSNNTWSGYAGQLR